MSVVPAEPHSKTVSVVSAGHNSTVVVDHCI